MKIYTENNIEAPNVEILFNYQELKTLVDALVEFEGRIRRYKMDNEGKRDLGFTHIYDSNGNRPAYIKEVTAIAIDEGSDFPVVDLTEKLDEFMEQNANKLKDYEEENGFVSAVQYFYNNVKTGGDLDIKYQDGWEFEPGKYRRNLMF